MQIRTAGAALLRGPSVSQFHPGTVKIVFLHVFFDMCFLILKKTVLFHLGWFWAPLKSNPTLQKACFYLGESTIFKKIMFLLNKNTVLEKTWFVIVFGLQKKHPKSSKNGWNRLTKTRLVAVPVPKITRKPNSIIIVTKRSQLFHDENSIIIVTN